MRLTKPSAITVVAVISGAGWVWSWRTMYLEIHRWKHVTRSFRFNPGPPIPGTNIRPRPGLPLKALFVCFAAAPRFCGHPDRGSDPRARRRRAGMERTVSERFEHVHDRFLAIGIGVLERVSSVAGRSDGRRASVQYVSDVVDVQ